LQYYIKTYLHFCCNHS